LQTALIITLANSILKSLSQTALKSTLANSSHNHSYKQLSKALLQTVLIITLANSSQKYSYKQLSKALLQTALIIISKHLIQYHFNYKHHKHHKNQNSKKIFYHNFIISKAITKSPHLAKNDGQMLNYAFPRDNPLSSTILSKNLVTTQQSSRYLTIPDRQRPNI